LLEHFWPFSPAPPVDGISLFGCRVAIRTSMGWRSNLMLPRLSRQARQTLVPGRRDCFGGQRQRAPRQYSGMANESSFRVCRGAQRLAEALAKFVAARSERAHAAPVRL
jgi:hypothetical protein